MRFVVGPAAALLLASATPRSAPPLALFGASKLPQAVVAIHDGFYEASEKERARGAPSKPPLSTVAQLWTALVKAYGSEELALRAARQNSQILNPLYTESATLITDSKACLVKAMGSEEDALKVMMMNPAVLQCGRLLASQPPDEIKRFAVVRSLFDAVPPQASLAALSLTLASVLVSIAFKDSDAESALQLLGVLKPAVGTIGAGIFLLTAANAARSQFRGGEKS